MVVYPSGKNHDLEPYEGLGSNLFEMWIGWKLILVSNWWLFFGNFWKPINFLTLNKTFLKNDESWKFLNFILRIKTIDSQKIDNC
jgi:fatty acid desaturase